MATPNNPNDTQDALVALNDRNQFYRDSYRKVLIALNISVIALIMLICTLIYIINNPPAPKYFATFGDGRVVPLVPLNMPNVSQAAMLQWANSAVVAVNTYDFFNYRQQLQAASQYFTDEGWQAYLNVLRLSRNLNAVVEKKLVVSAVATRAPVLVRSGLIDGVYTWVVQIPIQVTYQSASEYNQQSQIVTVMVKRISTLINPDGIGITNYIGADAPADATSNISAASQG